MKKEKDEGLDDLFKKGLEDPVSEAAFRDADWEAMEQMLDKPKKRAGIVYWLPYLGSAAALMLLFLGWMLFKPQTTKNTKPDQVAAVRHPAVDTNSHKSNLTQENTGTSGGSPRQAADSSKQKTSNTANYANNHGTAVPGQKANRSLPYLRVETRRGTTGSNNPDGIVNQQPGEALATNTIGKIDNKSTAGKQNVVAANNNLTANAPSKLSANDTSIKQNMIANNTTSVDSAANKRAAANNKIAQTAQKTIKPAIKAGLAKRPQFAIGVLASSDLNGVNSLQGSKVGSNFGLLLSVGLSKWTISTGASYAIKPYQTGFDNYHTGYQFTTDPVNVSANCRMLDIPLNINYQVYGKHNNKITIGSGLSSYIMLREDYNFNYANTYTTGPTTYSVVNRNRTYLGIVNLDATYQHQINSKVGLLIEPYYKLPLANVGASQVRLQTAGVAIGLNWNLNTLTKP